MSSLQGFITLDEAVREYLLVSKRHLNEFSECLVHAKRGLQELNWDISAQIRSVELPVEPGNIVRWPDDMVQYVQVSVCKDGTKVSLGLNPQMCSNNYDSCGQIIARSGGNLEPSGLFLGANVFSPAWTSVGTGPWNYWGQTLGISGGFSSIGYFKVDRNLRIFELNERFTGTTIILDYVTDGYSPQGTTVDGKNLIHVFLQEPISFYISWSLCAHVRSRIGEAREYRREFIRSKEQAFRRLKPLRLRELINAARQSFFRGVKF